MAAIDSVSTTSSQVPTMLFKPAYMMLLALVVLFVAMSSLQSQVEAGAKWDGGSCGFDMEASVKLFRGTCENIRGKVNCWN
ncbi:hypothetical protein BG015_005891 [Linnemannia schmuckeri]|uniref:Uncharacterized protein n=1 Tax=Linnemannia schmuckeri TaxID=64567 RepID=A0A9P5UVG0_9FUNG|nr:hypothetical protein BG015_005891 [Linnemannia schmuckeri]